MGTYEARLRWQQEPLGNEAATPIELDDDAVLSLAYDGAPAAEDCLGQLLVPVTLALETTTSAISEHGGGELVLSSPSEPLTATLVFRGARVKLDVTLAELAADRSPHGGLNALDSRLPGLAATFITD